MAMEINSVYSSCADSYTKSANSRKQITEKSNTTKEVTQTSSTARKTAADELEYLSKKYSNYSFVAANYTMGMQYGSSSTVNVAISPQFLAKMASDPELEKEYEINIAAMQACDEQNVRAVEAGGWHVVAQGWAIDKDGGISSWSIVSKNTNEKSYLQKMSENVEEIREKNAERKRQQEEVEEKRQAAKEEKTELKEKMKETGRTQFSDKFKSAIVTTKDDEDEKASRGADKDKAMLSGTNLDIKA